MLDSLTMTDATLPAVALGSDHAGFPLKSVLVRALRDAGHEVLDLGTNSPDRVDYPDFAHAVADAVEAGRARFGVLVCGSGWASPSPPTAMPASDAHSPPSR